MLFLKNNKYSYSQLLNEWLSSKKKDIKEQSYIKYKNIVESYIVPIIGDYNLKILNENQITNFFNNDKIINLSLSTKRTIIYIIKNSIEFGVENKIIKPLNNLDIKIKKPKSKIIYLTKSEQERLEQYLKRQNDIKSIGILICLYTGIRLGEICGLKWEDIDFYNKSLSINRTVQRIKNNDINATTKTKKIISSPKSDASKRVIPLPSFLIELLRKYRSCPDYFVLTNDTFFKDTRVYEKYFENILRKNDLRLLNFHTLRHTFATRCIESGMDIKTLSEILGHSSYHITLEIYVHSTIDQKRSCIDNLVNYVNPVVEY